MPSDLNNRQTTPIIVDEVEASFVTPATSAKHPSGKNVERVSASIEELGLMLRGDGIQVDGDAQTRGRGVVDDENGSGALDDRATTTPSVSMPRDDNEDAQFPRPSPIDIGELQPSNLSSQRNELDDDDASRTTIAPSDAWASIASSTTSKTAATSSGVSSSSVNGAELQNSEETDRELLKSPAASTSQLADGEHGLMIKGSDLATWTLANLTSSARSASIEPSDVQTASPPTSSRPISSEFKRVDSTRTSDDLKQRQTPSNESKAPTEAAASSSKPRQPSAAITDASNRSRQRTNEANSQSRNSTGAAETTLRTLPAVQQTAMFASRSSTAQTERIDAQTADVIVTQTMASFVHDKSRQRESLNGGADRPTQPESTIRFVEQHKAAKETPTVEDAGDDEASGEEPTLPTAPQNVDRKTSSKEAKTPIVASSPTPIDDETAAESSSSPPHEFANPTIETPNDAHNRPLPKTSEVTVEQKAQRATQRAQVQNTSRTTSSSESLEKQTLTTTASSVPIDETAAATRKNAAADATLETRRSSATTVAAVDAPSSATQVAQSADDRQTTSAGLELGNAASIVDGDTRLFGLELDGDDHQELASGGRTSATLPLPHMQMSVGDEIESISRDDEAAISAESPRRSEDHDDDEPSAMLIAEDEKGDDTPTAADSEPPRSTTSLASPHSESRSTASATTIGASSTQPSAQNIASSTFRASPLAASTSNDLGRVRDSIKVMRATTRLAKNDAPSLTKSLATSTPSLSSSHVTMSPKVSQTPSATTAVEPPQVVASPTRDIRDESTRRDADRQSKQQSATSLATRQSAASSISAPSENKQHEVAASSTSEPTTSSNDATTAARADFQTSRDEASKQQTTSVDQTIARASSSASATVEPLELEGGGRGVEVDPEAPASTRLPPFGNVPSDDWIHESVELSVESAEASSAAPLSNDESTEDAAPWPRNDDGEVQPAASTTATTSLVSSDEEESSEETSSTSSSPSTRAATPKSTIQRKYTKQPMKRVVAAPVGGPDGTEDATLDDFSSLAFPTTATRQQTRHKRPIVARVLGGRVAIRTTPRPSPSQRVATVAVSCVQPASGTQNRV